MYFNTRLSSHQFYELINSSCTLILLAEDDRLERNCKLFLSKERLVLNTFPVHEKSNITSSGDCKP